MPPPTLSKTLSGPSTQEAAAEAPADHRADRMTDRGEQDRAAEGYHRKPPRLLVADDRRADTRSDIRAERETGEGEDTDDEASSEPGERRERDHGEDDQIDCRHT